jgi:molybdenum cofactor cytidylyltransferase
VIVGILLAAGRGTRFGSHKLLHRLPDATPMALAALRNLAPSVDSVIVVVRPDDSALIQLLSQQQARIVPCPNAELGMGASLACGVSATPEADGWLIALADMPYVPTAVIAALNAELQAGAPLVAPTYQGQRGHPVGFSHAFYSELSALSGDRGARHLLDQHAEQLRLIAVVETGILRDIDTPEDLT